MCRLAPLFFVIACTLGTGCGYLDTEISMSDEEWEGSMGTGGIGVSGKGFGWGCGGGMIGFSSRAPRSVGYAGGGSSMTLADMYIYGSRARFEGVEASPSDVAVVAPAPEPVDWVGHFDDVSSERQNVLLAAWIEGQLDDVESSDAADLESPDASDRSRKAR